MRSDPFAAPLAAFLSKIQTLIPDLRVAGWHVRFPAGLTYIGSEVGKLVWTSDEAAALLDFLLQDPILQPWFGALPEPNLVELRGMLGSVVDRWVSSGASPVDFATGEAEAVLAALRAPEAVYQGIALAHGVEAAAPIALPGGLSVTPWRVAELARLPRAMPISELEVMRFPRGPVVQLASSVLFKREEFGPFAGSSARNFAQINLERLRTAVWLASGTLPAKGDVFLRHDAPYPVMPIERESPFVWERFANVGPGLEPPTIDPSILRGVVARFAAIFGDADVLDDDTSGRLHSTMTYADSALDSLDGLMTLFTAYAALDGLLLDEDDHHSRLGPRIARLIGGSDEDRKYLRRFVSGVYELRGGVAHGRRPLLARAAEVLGHPVTDEEWHTRLLSLGPEIRRLAAQRSLDLLRRALVAFLWLAVEVDPADSVDAPTIRRGLSRADIIDLLERAERNDAIAEKELNEKIPICARQP